MYKNNTQSLNDDVITYTIMLVKQVALRVAKIKLKCVLIGRLFTFFTLISIYLCLLT